MTEIKLNKTDNRLYVAVDPDGVHILSSLRDLRSHVTYYFDSRTFATGCNWEEHRKAGWTIQKVHLGKGWP